MKTCSQCGNRYESCFEIHYQGTVYAFDSFECAIQKLAPVCSSCGCKIIGHGTQTDDKIYCCAHCARMEGVDGAQDHVKS